jgi:hypothetical protein
MQFDISRDFLDGLMLQQPQIGEGNAEIRASGQLHFLPSSPDGTMHTAIVGFALFIGPESKDAKPFAQGGWRFLFTTDARFDPKADPQNQFFANMLVIGSGKVMVLLNNLCMHAGLPLIPFDPNRMFLQAPQQQAVEAAQQQQQQAKG